MKKFIENNLKLIIGLIIGAILTGGIVYAATSARDVIYTRNGSSVKNVEEALNDLYKINNTQNTLYIEKAIGSSTFRTYKFILFIT